ncbi:putative neprosin [Dioscorea sansibarensis]
MVCHQLSSTQFSSSLIWVVNDENIDQINQIAVGWTVNPSTYGDKNTRLLTSWTVDSYEKTGCVDMRCPGFVQVSQIVTLGGAYNPVSTYNGTQHGIEIYIFRDPMTKDWWFAYGPDRILVGYWPGKIFTGLSDHASLLDFGGTAGNNQGADVPPMGSGHLPIEGLGKACFFIKVRHLNSDNQFIDLPIFDISPYVSSPCYGLGLYMKTDTSYADMFFFGGTGGSQNC